MKICILKETDENEKRVALVPDVAKKLINDGFEIFIESGAGKQSDFSDEDYKKHGVQTGRCRCSYSQCRYNIFCKNARY